MAPLFSFSLKFSPKKKPSYLGAFSHPLMGILLTWDNKIMKISLVCEHMLYMPCGKPAGFQGEVGGF
jgi:hypothetical protein